MKPVTRRQEGPLFWNDPLAWLVGKTLDLLEEGVRRLVEATLEALPKPKPRKRLRK